MKSPIVFMFSGQGSQFYTMGNELYLNHPRFKYWMDHCDDILKPMVQMSLVEILYNEAHEGRPFDDIQYSNPALVCIEYSLARTIMEMGIQPEYLLGYSLGEITASAISGVMNLELAIRFSIDIADIVRTQTKPAKMLGIIDTVDLMQKFPEIFHNCWLAGKNFRNSFVVSGLEEDISILRERLTQKNILFHMLPVNYGFHTPLMDPIEKIFRERANEYNFTLPRTPMISPSRENVVETVDAVHYWDVIRRPVQFEETILSMLSKDDYIFIDVGPSGALSTAVKYILPSDSQSRHFEIINQFGNDVTSFERFKTNMQAELAD